MCVQDIKLQVVRDPEIGRELEGRHGQTMDWIDTDERCNTLICLLV